MPASKVAILVALLCIKSWVAGLETPQEGRR